MPKKTLPTRADQVRDRRKKAAGNPARTSKRTRQTTKTPPVITRGSKVVMPTRPIAPTRTRRRYDVSLSTPGSELRLPAVPTLRWNWRMFSGLLTLLLLGGLYAFWSMPIFRISAVQITGLQRISERDVKLVLGLTNTPMFILQPEVMQRNLLEAFPEFSNARVELVWPNGVMVSVIERVPVLAWTVGGQRVWVDAQGMSFPARGEGNAPALVVIEAQDAPPTPAGAGDLPEDTNPWFRPFMSPDLVSAILILRGFAPESVPLLYDAAHGLGWLDPNGWQVYFGPDGSDMGQRLQVYQAIVSKLNENQMTPALISVEYLHAPFYRMDQ